MADKIQRDSRQSAQEQLDSAEKKAQELVASAQNRADVLETAASVKASQLTEESKRNATERITSAERTASAMISNAEAKANEIIESAKKNAQLELDRINTDIRVNSATLEKLESEVSAFRNFILDAYQKHINLVSSLPQKQEMPIIPTINTDEYVSGNSAPVEDDADADNDIVIDDAYVSHHHAVINQVNQRYVLEDLESVNHTYLNDRILRQKTILQNGDRIKIGLVTFKFER